MQEWWVMSARVVGGECKSGRSDVQECRFRIARVAGEECESGRSGVMSSSMKGEECKKG